MDFLVGVSDLTRQGALRLKVPPGGAFLGESHDVPKLLELPRLLRAADAVTRDDDFAAIRTLLDAGTGSLGGARPKASVREGDQLLIAKFPHPDDEWDVMAWEKVALDLAAAAGIRVPGSSLVRVDGRSVLLIDRFDRRDLSRVPYFSAMTLLEARDGEQHDYVEIAETLPEVSSATTPDLREPGGWRLSPAFDLNPNPDQNAARQTSIGGADRHEDAIASLILHARDFGLTPDAADAVLREIAQAVARWRAIATRHGIDPSQQARLAAAFRLPA